MVEKKRGLVLVVFVAFLVVMSVGVLGVPDKNTDAFPTIGHRADLGYEYDQGCGSYDVDDCPQGDTYKLDEDHSTCSASGSDLSPLFDACKIFFVDKDEGNDDGGFGLADEGYILDSVGYEKLGLHSYEKVCGQEGDHDNDGVEGLKGAKFKAADNTAYICGNNLGEPNKWYKCTSETLDTVTWANGDLYNCTFSASTGFPTWKNEGGDTDFDTFAQEVDCKDNPPSGSCLNLAPEDCASSPENYECPQCINPDAPEVCGDGKNNDCNEATSDNCHDNQAACEALDTAVGWNIHDEKYAWQQTGSEGAGFCCGFSGSGDGNVGEVSESIGGTNKLCVNKEYTTTNGEISSSETEGVECSGSGWCLVSAVVGSKFQIYTIAEPEKEPYDVVSNGDNWYECSSSYHEPLLPEDTGVRTKANAFYCFDEGNHWSWAECPLGEEGEVESENSGTTKIRHKGDGLYQLFPTNDKNQFGVLVDAKDPIYTSLYSEDFLLDFSGYNQLNFMIQFLSEVTLPADVKVQIYGSDDELKWQGNVLGFSTNNPVLVADTFFHVQVPIAPFKDVEKVLIESIGDFNHIEVKNIYMSVQGEQPYLCSAKQSNQPQQPAWLTNADDIIENTLITGENICNELYGGWLGDEVDDVERRCCGDDVGEYYAGPGKNGCWNSEVVVGGGTMMNAQVEVTSQYSTVGEVEGVAVRTVTFEWDYATPSEDPVTLTDAECKQYTKEHNCPIGCKWVADYGVGCIALNADAIIAAPTSGVNTQEASIEIEYDGSTVSPKSITLKELGFEVEGVESGELSINTGIELFIAGSFQDHGDEFEFFSESDYILGNNQFEVGDFKDISFSFVHDDNYYENNKETVKKLVVGTQPEEMMKTYSCSQAACTFPIPGFPPYTISNPFPDLYEIYFVDGPGIDDRHPIDKNGKTFDQVGNVEVTKVAQQVVLVNSDTEHQFYGCAPSQTLINSIPTEDQDSFTALSHCAVKADRFCSFSYTEDGVTTINSWSDDALEHVGYEALEDDPKELEGLHNLQLKTLPTNEQEIIPPTDRNWSTTAFPGQNILPNALFEIDSQGSVKRIAHWVVIDSEGLEVSNVNAKHIPFDDPERVELGGGEILRSSRIALPQGVDETMALSHEGEGVKESVILVDGEGDIDIVNDGEFSTDGAGYVVIEFTGPGSVAQPILQFVDEDFEPVAFHYDGEKQKVQENFQERAGVACCPQDWCWNGYTCAEPMSENTFAAELLPDNRTYRCVGGEWTELPVKRDWNVAGFGFCEQKDQCFVTSSLMGGDNTAEAIDFYNGNYPTCVDDGEFIFDHYCDAGNWTSRTKFIASELLDAIGETDEYALYCDSFEKVLPQLDGHDLLFSGELVADAEVVGSISDQLGGVEPEQTFIQVCFENVNNNERGRELVPTDQNKCVNNVCVLQYKQGGKNKVAFAASLNPAENSFLTAFDIPAGEVATLCGGEGFNDCNVDLAGDFWYSEELDAFVYGKDGIDLDTGFFGGILDFFSGLFGNGIAEENTDFIAQAENYRDVYVLQHENKLVRAIKEQQGQKEILVAEFEGFQSPVCEYVENVGLPEKPAFEGATSVDLVCSSEEGVQKFELVDDTDVFWDRFAGRLRPQESS